MHTSGLYLIRKESQHNANIVQTGTGSVPSIIAVASFVEADNQPDAEQLGIDRISDEDFTGCIDDRLGEWDAASVVQEVSDGKTRGG